MKTSKLVICLGAFLLITCFVSCTHREKQTYCENFTNKDSLIQRILIEYDEEAYSGLCCCHEDTNMDLYGFLIADSIGRANCYFPLIDSDGNSYYGLSDTVVLFYETKGFTMGVYVYYLDDINHKIAFPEKISTKQNIIIWTHYLALYSEQKMLRHMTNCVFLCRQIHCCQSPLKWQIECIIPWLAMMFTVVAFKDCGCLNKNLNLLISILAKQQIRCIIRQYI